MDAILSKGSLGTLATVATVLQFLTGTVICNRYIRKKSTGDTSAFPFISGFLSCFMWLKYGVLTEESTVMLVNFIGSALFFSYTVVFFVFCVNKREVIRQMMLISCIILSATFYTMFESDAEKSIRIIGLLCCCLAVLFFASPLTMLAHVIRTQNTDSLPFPIIVASFFVCFLWTAYGVSGWLRDVACAGESTDFLTCLLLLLQGSKSSWRNIGRNTIDVVCDIPEAESFL
uniref:Sugar transporter SWEET n=1 Tax=Anopheles maculatus TaxID=74869 RepID=A0A182S9B4_9DIPT